jgi:nicotinate dehydrogenase subunit B
MTGHLDGKEFSRRSFVKGGGAMIVGFSLAGAGLAGRAQAADSPFASHSFSNNQVDSFITIYADNTASIKPGGGEHGTGTSTGWLMLAGEELDMDMSQLTFVPPDSAVTPANAATNSSQGTKFIGPQVRMAAAHAKQALLALAATSLGVPASNLTVKSGVVSGGGKSVTYGQLIGGKLFNVIVPTLPSSVTSNVSGNLVTQLSVGNMQGTSPSKSPDQYKLVGTRVPRIDIPDMVTGKAVYAVDIRVPGMLHGRIVLPRGQAAYGFGAPVVSVDQSSIGHIPNVQLVRKNNFIGVVAEQEWDAIEAAAQLKVTWADPPAISGSGNLWSKMRADDAAGNAPARYEAMGGIAGPIGKVDAALASAARVVSQTYAHPYNIHAPIGPGCVVADVTPAGALVMCHTQVPADLQNLVASVVGLPANAVRVKVYPGSSHYGNSFGRRDAPLAAAVMSQIVGKPVRLQFMRWDEMGWDIFGTPHLMDMRGGVDATGKIVGWDRTEYTPPNVPNVAPTIQQLLGNTVAAPGLGAYEDQASGFTYNLPNWRVTAKTVPLINNYFKTSNMRASESQQETFATEIFADELAHAAGMDPIAFRRLNVSQLNSDRYLGVLDALQQAANWQPKVAASKLSTANIVTGRGVSFAPRSKPLSFSGVIVDLEVNKTTGKIVVKHIYAAQDQGLAVNPMGIENQIVGQVVQSTSRGLLEEVRFDTRRVTSLDWVTYPILRFKDAPKVTPIIISRPDVVMSGAGDYTSANVPAAIANAFFDATGVRIRTAPMNPARVRGTLRAASVA